MTQMEFRVCSPAFGCFLSGLVYHDSKLLLRLSWAGLGWVWRFSARTEYMRAMETMTAIRY